MNNPSQNASQIRKKLVLILLGGSILWSSAQVADAHDQSFGGLDDLWNLPADCTFLEKLANSYIQPGGPLIIDIADALILQPPTGDIIADIATVDSRIATPPTGVLSTSVQVVKNALGVGGGTSLQTDVMTLDGKVLSPPTGNLNADINTVDAMIVISPTGVLSTDIQTVKTLVGINGPNLQSDLRNLDAKIVNAPTDNLNTDLTTLKTLMGVNGPNLESDLLTLDNKILNPATGNILADINTVGARIATPSSGILSIDVQTVKNILGVGGTSLETDSKTIDNLILPPIVIPPSVPLQTHGSNANTGNVYADIASVLNGPSGTSTLGIGVVGTTSLGEAIGSLDYLLLGTAATGNLFNDIGSIDVSILPASSIPANSLNTAAVPQQFSAAVPQKTGVITNDIAIVKDYLGIGGPITLGEAAGILDYRIYGDLATNNVHNDLESIINGTPTPSTTTIGFTTSSQGAPSLREILGTIDNSILGGARTGNIIADIATLDAEIATPATGVLSTDVQTVKTALGIGGTTSLQADVTTIDGKVLSPPTGDLNADITTVDNSLLPFPAISASGTTAAVPARQGILSLDVAGAHSLVLPLNPIASSPTTAPVAGQTPILGTDLGTTDAYLLPQFITGIAPARTGIIGEDAGLVDGLLLPWQPIPGSSSNPTATPPRFSTAVPQRTGVIGTDINTLDGLLGVSGPLTLGEEIGILDYRIYGTLATNNLSNDIESIINNPTPTTNTTTIGYTGPLVSLREILGTVDNSILGGARTGNIIADIAAVDDQILPNVAIPSSTTTSAVAAQTGVLGADLSIVDAYLLPLNPFGISPARTGIIGQDAGLIDGLLLPQFPITAGTLNTDAIPDQISAAVASRSGVIGMDINSLHLALGVGGPITLGESIGIVDASLLPFPAIAASGTTGSVPANQGILKTDVAAVDNLILPTVGIIASTTTAAVAGQSGVLGTDLGITDAYLLAQNPIGIAPARTNNIGRDEGLVDALLLPLNPVGTVPARTGVIGTDINQLKTYLGVGGTTSLGVDMGIIDEKIVINATGNLTADLATVTDLVGINGGDNLQADLRTLDQGIVINTTDNLSDDITAVKDALGVGGTTPLEGDVNFLDNLVTDGFPTGNLFNDITTLKSSISTNLTTIDKKILPLSAVLTGVGTYAVAASAGQNSASAADVLADIATVLNVPINTTASLGVVTGNGTLGESVGVLDYKVHAQTGTGSLFSDIDAVKARLGVNGNSLFDDATAIDFLIAPNPAIPFSNAGTGTAAVQANTSNVNADIGVILNGVAGKATLGVIGSTSIGQSIGILDYDLRGPAVTGNLFNDIIAVRGGLGVLGTNLADDVTTIDLRILPASAIPPSAVLVPTATYGCQARTGNVNNDITSILTGGPTTLGTVGISSLGEGIGILDYRVLGTSATGNLNLDLLQVVSHLGVAVSPPAIDTSVTILLSQINAVVNTSHPVDFIDLSSALNYLINRYITLGGN